MKWKWTKADFDSGEGCMHDKGALKGKDKKAHAKKSMAGDDFPGQ